MKKLSHDKRLTLLKLYPCFFQCHTCPALALGGLVAISLMETYWVFNTIYRGVKHSVTTGYRELVGSNAHNEKNCV